MADVTRPHHVAAGLPGYRMALAFPAFRRLCTAAVISRAGDAMNFVALPVFVYAATGSPTAVAALVIIEGAALIAGAAGAQLVVDRIAPRRLLVAVDAGRALAALALAAAPSFPMALAVAAMLALGTSWFSPTSAALVPRLVDEGALQGANALQWTAGVALQLVAAPLGGFLAGSGSARTAFGLNALSFALSAVVLAGLPTQPALAAHVSSWRHLPESLRTMRRIPVLAPLLLMQGIAALAVGATSALLVVLAERAYGLGGTGYGAWLAAVAVGALVGPFVVPWLANGPPGRTVGAAYLVRGAGDLGLGVLSNGVGGAALLAMYGLNTSAGTVAYQTLVQESVPPALRGRAFAVLDVIWQSGRLLSIALGGVLAGAVGIRPVFFAGGSLLLVAGVIGVLALRHVDTSESSTTG